MQKPLLILVALAAASSASAQPEPRKLKPADFAGSFATLVEEAAPGPALASRFGENVSLQIRLTCDAAGQRLVNCRGQTSPGEFEQKAADRVAGTFERRGRLRAGINGPVMVAVRLLINPS